MTIAMSDRDHRELLLELLSSIGAFCSDAGLTYFIYAGTLLGAVRHNGFIPWDDDLDVMMPRRDYETFCRSFPRDGRIYLANGQTHPSFPYAYAKVCYAGTVRHEPVRRYGDPPFGVNVDVIPYDVVPRREWTWTWHRRLAMAIRAVLLAKVVEPRPELKRSTRLVLRGAQILLRPVPTRFLTRARTRVATLCGRKSTGYVGMLVASVPWRVEDSTLRPDQAMFEGREVPAPAGATDLLTHIYGDFMQLPPEAARVAPHPGQASWIAP